MIVYDCSDAQHKSEKDQQIWKPVKNNKDEDIYLNNFWSNICYIASCRDL